jgi:hypothetical protein
MLHNIACKWLFRNGQTVLGSIRCNDCDDIILPVIGHITGLKAANASMIFNRKANTCFSVRSYQQAVRNQKVKRQLPYPNTDMAQQ